jgi:hypothetical protein
MADGDCEISTESEDAEDFPEDSTAGKLLPSDVANGSSDSGSDRDDESEMGKVPFRRRRVEWETVETIVRYFRTATYEIALSIMRSNL